MSEREEPGAWEKPCGMCGGKMYRFNAHYDRCENCSAPSPRPEEAKECNGCGHLMAICPKWVKTPNTDGGYYLACCPDCKCQPAAQEKQTLKFFCNHGEIDCPKCQPKEPSK